MERTLRVMKREEVPSDARAPGDTAPPAWPRMRGVLDKRTSSAYVATWQTRLFELRGTYLVYADARDADAALGAIDLRWVAAVRALGRTIELAFDGESSRDVYALRAPDARGAEAWAAALRVRVDAAASPSLPSPDSVASPPLRRLRLGSDAPTPASAARTTGTDAAASVVVDTLSVFMASGPPPSRRRRPPPLLPLPPTTSDAHARRGAHGRHGVARRPLPEPDWLDAYPHGDAAAWALPTAAWLEAACLTSPTRARTGDPSDGADAPPPHSAVIARLARDVPAAAAALGERCSAARAVARHDVAEHLCDAWSAHVVFHATNVLQARTSLKPAHQLRVAALLRGAAAAASAVGDGEDEAAAAAARRALTRRDSDDDGEPWRQRLVDAADDAESLFLANVEATLRACAARILRRLGGGTVEDGGDASDAWGAPHAALLFRARPTAPDALAPAPSGTTLAHDFFAIAGQFWSASCGAVTPAALSNRCRVVACCEAALMAGNALADAAAAAASPDLTVGRLHRTLQLQRALHEDACRVAEGCTETAHLPDLRRAEQEVQRATDLTLDLSARLVGEDAVAAWTDAFAAAAARTQEVIADLGVGTPLLDRAAHTRLLGRVAQRLVLHAGARVYAPTTKPMSTESVAECVVHVRSLVLPTLGEGDTTLLLQVLTDALALLQAASPSAAAATACSLARGRARAAVRHVHAAARIIVRRRWGRAAALALQAELAAALYREGGGDGDECERDAEDADWGPVDSDVEWGWSALVAWRADAATGALYHKCLGRAR